MIEGMTCSACGMEHPCCCYTPDQLAGKFNTSETEAKKTGIAAPFALSEDEIRELEARAAKARKLLGEACSRGHLRMCIPARPDEDDDLVIADVLDDVPRLLQEVRALRTDKTTMQSQIDRMKSAGYWLSNAAFNLSQDAVELTPERRNSLRVSCKYWDDALPSPPPTTPHE